MDSDGRRPLPDTPPNPADDERTVLVQFLEYYRIVLIRKLQGMDDAGRRLTVGSSNLTLAGLVKHMACVEDGWFAHRFAGQEGIEPWTSAPWDTDPDWEMTTAVDDTEDELVSLFDAACARSRAVLDACSSLDDTAAGGAGDDPPASMRWILVHMIEEYARHCGHADLLRESADGTVDD
ncbi:MAG: DinB family protein [Actinomycetota bacterium]